jgi:uncharacterized protein (DUF697 family)
LEHDGGKAGAVFSFGNLLSFFLEKMNRTVFAKKCGKMDHYGQKSLFTSGGNMSAKLEKIIENHVYMSMGIGLLPLPFFDVVAITGIQLSLTKKLAERYNIPFSQDMGKNIIGALAGGCFSVSVGSRILFSVTKIVPIVGLAVGLAGSSIVAGASTYALGRVFHRHFSEGGTLLSFDPKKARAFYKEMFKEGQEIAQTPHRLPKFFDFEEIEVSVMTILGKIITGLDTLTKSKSTMFAINT